MIVSAVASPSTNGNFSSTMKWRRSGTASKTPSEHAAVSHKNDFIGVSVIANRSGRLWRRMSNAPSSTHMNAVCDALVPAASTRLFCQRL